MAIVSEIEALYEEAATSKGAAEAVLISRIHRILERVSTRAPKTSSDLCDMLRLLRWLVRNSELNRRAMEHVEAGLRQAIAEIEAGALTRRGIVSIRLAQALGDKAEPHIWDVAERVLEAMSGGATVH